MTKADLVEKIAATVNLTKKETEVVIDTIFDGIARALASPNDGKVELRGFGSFRVRRRRPRQGRNPQTGQPVSVPAKKVPYFKPGKELKALIDR
jgi:integration host factor subunit beta